MAAFLALAGVGRWIDQQRPTLRRLGAVPMPPPAVADAAWEQTGRCVRQGRRDGWGWYVTDSLPWPHTYPTCPQCQVLAQTIYSERAIVLTRPVLADPRRLPGVVRHEYLHVRLGPPPVGTPPGWHDPVFYAPSCGAVEG